ncbi:MAG: tetratricopeptide repeat protein [Ktedonobacteraceae bacterium]
MQSKLHVISSGQHSESGQAARSNIPVQLTPLIGREREVKAACALLRRSEVRLLTLTGPGGVGKTRVALQVATELLDDFAEGIYFVSLAHIDDPVFIIPTLARTLGFGAIADGELTEHVKAYLREKHLLLLLDNFEHLVPAALLLVELLTSCPALKLLVTSRTPLHLRGEHEFPVPPLALPDLKHRRTPAKGAPTMNELSQYAATALFVQRALAVDPDFQVTDANAPVIAEICVRLDGLPLAIELAAARIKLLSLQSLLARLEQRLHILTGGAQDLPERQQTLRNTLKWSYDLLNKSEQRLFRRLSVFVDGCTMEAIDAVSASLGDGELNVLDRVASLLDKSQLQRIEVEGDARNDRRLVMLETIREYGLELLAAHSEMEATQQAHAAYFLALTEKAEPNLTGAEQGKWFDRLEREHENLRAALHYLVEWAETEMEAREGRHQDAGSQAEMALRLGTALWGFWTVRGHWSEFLRWLERALAADRTVAPAVRAKALNAAGMLAYLQDNHGRAEQLCSESLALFRQIGDKRGIASSLIRLGQVAKAKRNYAAARTQLEEGLALSKEIGDKGTISDALLLLARAAINLGEYSRARSLLEEGLALSREMSDKWDTAMALYHLARAVFSEGDLAEAHKLLTECLAIDRELGYKEGVAYALRLTGQLVFQQSDDTTARPLLEESVAIFRGVGDKGGAAKSLFRLANVVAFQGDNAAARGLFEESLSLLREIDDKEGITSCLEGFAGVIAAQREPVRAILLWGAVESLREALGSPIPPIERASYERMVAVIRAQLSEQAFAAIWAEGRTMTPEQALVAEGGATMPLSLSASSIYPAGLTGREVEVLRLIAEGLTNAQIADQLVISPLTVNTHVRSIYNRLEVSSRSAATRFAIQHQLV